MTPTTRHVCLTVLEATKDVCFTIPTLEGIKVAINRFYHEVVMQHPYIFAAALLFWSFYPQFPFHVIYFVFYVLPRSIILGFLTCLGYERGGVREDSIASRYQVRRYGRETPVHVLPSYGSINHNTGNAQVPPSHPALKIFWRFIAIVCLYASLVILLKYGD